MSAPMSDTEFEALAARVGALQKAYRALPESEFAECAMALARLTAAGLCLARAADERVREEQS